MRSQASLTAPAAELSTCLDRLVQRREQQRPGATYRLQFNHKFHFSDAVRLVPYLNALGVTTCYTSPILRARTGSSHGYDITSHDHINPEIGTEEELRELVAALHANGMTLMLDVVPNHMGVGYGSNQWWFDVLQNGRASKFANFFDIDWNPLKPELRNKVLLPVLGNQYGQELESGKLRLTFKDGEFQLEYYDRRLPISPQTIPLIFHNLPALAQSTSNEARELKSLLISFSELPSHDSTEPERALRRQREYPLLRQRLADLVTRVPEIQLIVNSAIEKINGEVGKPQSFDLLHTLLEAQPYRLAHWRVSAEEINYRRFFDINDLVGLRMEDPLVFAATQMLIRRLLADGSVSALRIDHPDGLFNPPQYFTRLQMLYSASQCCGPEPQGALAENGIELELQTQFGQRDWNKQNAPVCVLVEKILEPGEHLPDEWPVDGTVGYDFTNLATNLFIDSRNRRAFNSLYTRFAPDMPDVDTVIYNSKKLIMEAALSSEVNVLGHMLDEISSMDRHARDFTRKSLRDAIRETIANFPVYRTYIDERGNITERDRRYIEQAINHAKRRNSATPPEVFDFLCDNLLLRGGDIGQPVHGYRKQLYFTLKFQQLSGPVMAKGLEDTACYVHNRFIAVNEVGGSPAEFGIELDAFHRANAERAAEWPGSMLSTSTHDTKRSEDVRMRLDVLTEMPRHWAAQVMRWRRINRPRRRTISDGRLVPDSNEEFLLYQTLAGAWPLPNGGGENYALDAKRRAEFTQRIQQYMYKATHEAKMNVSWLNQNPEYSNALDRFVARILTPGTVGKPNTFLRLIQEFLPRFAMFGALNSLSQVLIKVTAPGVPDIYQGQELFDFSLVDPDNRRPVDFVLREQFLGRLQSAQLNDELLQQLLGGWHDGRIKMWVTHRALAIRAKHPELFAHGAYRALYAGGDFRRHIVAFARTHQRENTVTAVPRFAYSLMDGEVRWPLGDTWKDAELEVPKAGEWQNALTGEALQTSASRTLLCREIFRRFPVALLVHA
ncbi:MAG TPA: malto-oligosyltrehalose synthase [Candidatus Acidoferrales bacterium]|nr:malto-oligosyltrehalose synthase [Candidatus Acidoferrales bacterium]